MQNRRETPASAGFLQKLADPGYRLPGENPANATVEQARGWAETYDKLIAFKRDLLELCHRYAEQAEPEVARAIGETDVIMLEVQLSRFEQKRDFWKLRATELAGHGRGRERSG